MNCSSKNSFVASVVCRPGTPVHVRLKQEEHGVLEGILGYRPCLKHAVINSSPRHCTQHSPPLAHFTVGMESIALSPSRHSQKALLRSSKMRVVRGNLEGDEMQILGLFPIITLVKCILIIIKLEVFYYPHRDFQFS